MFNKREYIFRLSNFIYFNTESIKDWWEKYNNFVQTLAQWSYLGYIVGLGDRHCNNILITDKGKLIHIDF
jgi:ataxia telangiectasia mutated family protein